MTDWSEIELQALSNFLATPGPLKTALQTYINSLAQHHKTECAACMASVPRDPERAADHAAKAQVLDEFWAVLTDQLISFALPPREPTPQEMEE